MGLEQRGEKIYFYKKVRANGRVRSIYVAAGDEALRQAEISQRNKEVQRATRARLSSFMYDAEFRNYFRVVTRWVDAMMQQTGHSRHKGGEWRPIRDQAQSEPTLSQPAALSELVMFNMLSSFQAQDGASTQGFCDIVKQDIFRRYQELISDGDSAIEQVLAFRIALTEARVLMLESLAYQCALLESREAVERQISSADRRLAQSCRALIAVRRIPNLTLVQVNSPSQPK